MAYASKQRSWPRIAINQPIIILLLILRSWREFSRHVYGDNSTELERKIFNGNQNTLRGIITRRNTSRNSTCGKSCSTFNLHYHARLTVQLVGPRIEHCVFHFPALFVLFRSIARDDFRLKKVMNIILKGVKMLPSLKNSSGSGF